uniref:Uncharacterized protein n=1 Tax=Arundo donax TaxID=35708 RepID=A0A0A9GNB9_ARUDO
MEYKYNDNGTLSWHYSFWSFTCLGWCFTITSKATRGVVQEEYKQ